MNRSAAREEQPSYPGGAQQPLRPEKPGSRAAAGGPSPESGLGSPWGGRVTWSRCSWATRRRVEAVARVGEGHGHGRPASSTRQPTAAPHPPPATAPPEATPADPGCLRTEGDRACYARSAPPQAPPLAPAAPRELLERQASPVPARRASPPPLEGGSSLAAYLL